MQKNLNPWVSSLTFLLFVGCSYPLVESGGSELASIHISGLPEGVDKSASTLTVSKGKEAKPTSYRLNKLGEETLEPGRYHFELMLHDGTNEMGRTKEGSVVCPPLKNQVIRDGTNNLNITVCKRETDTPIPPSSKNEEGSVDIDVDMIEDMDLDSYTSISVNEIFDELMPALKEFQFGRETLYEQLKVKYHKNSKWHFRMRPGSTGATYLHQSKYLTDFLGEDRSVSILVRYDGSKLSPLEIPKVEQPVDIYGTLRFLNGETNDISLHFNGFIKQ